jgi:methyltransferase (TIGR00027 family)
MPASRTAEYVALYRALETTETRREPLFRDPYASLFLTGSRARWFALASVKGMRSMIERYGDFRAPGARSSSIAGTRYIDDVVRDEVNVRGIRQIVILGAGYDSRAHRIPELLKKGVAVFEVDTPELQAEKKARLKGLPNLHPVQYVPADLERDHLPTLLADEGWEADHRSIVIWEGVTTYLDEKSVGAVLDMVGGTKPGSSVVFTYAHKGVIDGSIAFEGAQQLLERVRMLGEPWRFGILPEQLGTFLEPYRMKLEQDIGADAYRAKYLRKDRGYAFYRIAVARVAGRVTPTPGSIRPR